MKVNTIAVLAGGLATRLYPITLSIPKSMIPIAGEPFIHHQMKLLKRKGIENVILCVGNFSEQIMEFIKDGKKYGLRILYSEDGDRLLGTAGAIKKALPLMEDPFFITYGDSYLDVDYQSVGNYFLNNNTAALITVIKNENRWDRSNIIFKNGKILRYDKTKFSLEMQYIDYGLGIFHKEAFKNIADNTPYDLADLYQELLSRNQLAAFEINNRFYEIGSVSGIKELEANLLAQRKEIE
ncbi:MAG: nucleotidyltransferase family protein [Bacteroidota bacterium]